MELVYLWVEEYKNIEEQEFNFSPKFNCHYDGETLTINKNIDEKGNKQYIENFFGDNINVTAIVGKNGSGKSNVLELIDNQSYENPKVSPFPVAVLDVGKIAIYYTEKEHNLYLYSKKELELTINVQPFIAHKTINTYEEDFQMIFTKPTPSHSQKEYLLLYDFLKNNNLYLPFEIPELINISIHDDYYDLLELIKNDDIDFSHTYSVFEEDISKRMKIYHILLLLAYLFNNKIDFDVVAKKDYNKTMSDLQTYIEHDSIKASISRFITSLQTYLEDFSFVTNNYINIRNVEDNFFKTYIEIIKRKNDNNSYSPFFGKNVFNFDLFPSMSDGEYQFIYLFNTIYSSIDKENILLLIDEGENFLHPNWQKKYISFIVQFIQDNFSDKKIHIIFTSHSPFLLSDIPKQNIIFLDTYEDGKCKVLKHDEVMNKKQTFGANIHTLLSDSFFMDDGLMGEFAKGKINEIIDFHNITKKKRHKKCLQKIYENREKGFRQTQSIVGDPYLKQVLENHLLEIDKFFDKKVAKEKLKARLQKQLAELDDD